MDVLVVGAGFSGAVIARELSEAGINVHIIDERKHIAGNCYDEVSDLGIRYHKYGPHIFHTNIDQVYKYLTYWDEFVQYRHRVKALTASGRLETIPPNIDTLKRFSRNEIIETFYRPYSEKMWGMQLEELDPTIVARVPIKEDLCDEYFPQDKYQGFPKSGYTKVFERILDHNKIRVNLNTKFIKRMALDYDFVFNSMPIDEFFGYQFGELPYRSLRFHNKIIDEDQYQSFPTINFTDTGKFTRVTEWKNYPGHGHCKGKTLITVEEPCDYKCNNRERYYPVKDVNGYNRKLFKRYKKLTPANMKFIGRCGLYTYINMDQAINMALQTAKNFLTEFNRGIT